MIREIIKVQRSLRLRRTIDLSFVKTSSFDIRAKKWKREEKRKEKKGKEKERDRATRRRYKKAWNKRNKENKAKIIKQSRWTRVLRRKKNHETRNKEIIRKVIIIHSFPNETIFFGRLKIIRPQKIAYEDRLSLNHPYGNATEARDGIIHTFYHLDNNEFSCHDRFFIKIESNEIKKSSTSFFFSSNYYFIRLDKSCSIEIKKRIP